MKCPLKRLLYICILAAPLVVKADVVVNEIMYYPSSTLTSEEYIEIYNRGNTNVQLQGWRFTRGVDFTFTNAVSLAPGGFLVVAADVATFQAKYPGVLNVTGNWTGTLANGGESIQLEDDKGNTMDRVRYADEGDWAIRSFVPDERRGVLGWAWDTLHDGLGSSAELVNPILSNNSGQNWLPSSVPQGTPGTVNSVMSTEIAPLILDVQHTPPMPSSSQPVSVTCRVIDEDMRLTFVTLFYRNASTTFPPPFTSTLMFDDGLHNDGPAGDGIYGAEIPAQAHNTVIEFYVEASDGDNSRTWPAPSRQGDGQFGQNPNAQYQVDETVYGNPEPLLRLVLTEAERVRLLTIERQSDAQMDATMISQEGIGTKIRYNVGVRIRGAGSRGRTPPNYRINIPSDNPWNDKDAINMNSQYAYLQVVGAAVSHEAGLPAADARLARLRVNGADPNPLFGVYALMEPLGSEWADAHFPNDGNGNVYRGSRFPWTANLDYQGTNPIIYQNLGYSKSSNQAENDWTDLMNLTFSLSPNTPDEIYADSVRTNANVEMFLRYFAVCNSMAYRETSLCRGVGDDYAMYRGVNDPRFLLIPHDFDTLFGLGDTGNNPTESIWLMVDSPQSNDPSQRANFLPRFMRHPEFVPFYYRELRNMAENVLAPENFDPLLDRLLGASIPEQNIESIRQFNQQRISFVLSQIPSTYSVNTGLPQLDNVFRTTSATLNLSGTANAIDTRRIEVNGLVANYTAWQGNWNLSGIPLLPGVNRLPVLFIGEQEEIVHQQTVDIYYDDGTFENVSGPLPVDTVVWSPAQSPYRVSGTVTVPTGGTLQILPGTTLFFAQGARLSVSGRLLAEGSETNRIRMTREPGTPNTWSGVVLNNSNQDNRLTYADMEFASANLCVDLNNSTLFIDQVTWTGTAGTIIDLSNSSLIVRNSIFPTINNSETIHGVGMPADGYVIIESNYFGGTTGYSDIIDFSGGQRPGPILQVYHNVFNGGSDDVLDLDGTDAHIEGNVFMNTHQDGGRDSGAYAIATDTDTDLYVVRNLFYDNDHALLLKNGASAIFHNNTVAVIRTNNFSSYPAAVISFGEPNRNVAGGIGADLAGNIFWDIDRDQHFLFFTNGVMFLNVNRSLLSGTNHPGSGNLTTDPLFVNANTNYVTAANIMDALSLQPGSVARGTGPNGLDMGALVPGGASVSGVPLSPTPKTSVTLTVAGPGITHYRYRFDDEAYSPEISLPTPITRSGLTDGAHSISVIGKNSAGVWQEMDEATVKSWTVETGVTRLFLNEILALNDEGLLHEGTFPDAIELYNDGDVAVSLKGMGLTDDPLDPYKFTFPAGVDIGPGQYLVVYADNEDTTSGLHLGFGLNQDGDSLYLFDQPGQNSQLLDSITFGLQLRDISIGRNAVGDWILTDPTFGAANLAYPVTTPERLKINEWGADGQSSFQDDFVELYNPREFPVLLSGLYLSDETITWPDRHQMPALSFIDGRGHLALLADGNPAAGARHLSFRLSPDYGAIGLFDANLNPIDTISYGPQSTDVSEGRRPSGSDIISFFGPQTRTEPTPGAPNPGQGGTISVTNIEINLLPIATDWRYERNDIDLGTVWRQPGFDDSGWPVGAALLGVEGSTLPDPGLNTFFPNYDNFQITYYFRKTFVVNTNAADFRLIATTAVDDGCVIHLNGSEVLRIRMPGGTIFHNTQALDPTVSNASLEFWELPGVTLPLGTNVLAVEVHQAGIPSSDIVFGMELNAVKTVTNVSQIDVVINEIMANNQTVTTPGDTNITDWVELYNPSALPVDLSDMSLSDNLEEPRRWVFPAGASIPASGYLIVRFDGNVPPSMELTNIFNTGFGLRAGGDEVRLYDAPARGSAEIDSRRFGLQAADFTIGLIPNATGTWTLTLPTPASANLHSSLGAQAALRFNEWMANPSGNDNDYFEIYNPIAQPVELSGLYLTDDLVERDKFRIPALSFVGVGEGAYAVFIADKDPDDGADHVNFRLSSDGESLGLFTANLSTIDTVTFGAQDNGISEGLFPDGNQSVERFPGTATPGNSNIRPLKEIVISEVLTHTDLPFEDAIELQNVSSGYMDISGWWLSDRRADPKRFRIPEGTVLSPGEHIVIYEYRGVPGGFNPNLNIPPSFALDSVDGDNVVLSTADENGNLTGFRTEARFGPSANAVSFGRYETSVGIDFPALNQRTFGADNPASVNEFRTGTGLSNAAPLVGPIVINEIQYHPVDIVTPDGTNDNVEAEFIELHNISGATEPLYDPAFPTNQWRLDDAVKFSFAPNTSIPAGGYLVVVSFDPETNTTALANFRATYGIGPEVVIVGPYSGKLDNSSEDIELDKPDAPQPLGTPQEGEVPFVRVDRVKYFDSSPWSPVADGLVGASLQRIASNEYGNDPVNWSSGPATPGAANNPNVGGLPVINLHPQSQSISADSTLTLSVISSGIWFQWLKDGQNILGATNGILSVVSVGIEDAGTYRVLVSNTAGAALSDPAVITVEAQPSILRQPTSKLVAAGSTALYGVSAVGALPMTFQWQNNGVDVPGGTSALLQIDNAQVAEEGGYSVVVANQFGAVTSQVATLIINQPPLITSQPQSQTVFVGQTATFTVTSTGTPPLRYTWLYEGAVLPGQTEPALVLEDVSLDDAGQYAVRINNNVGETLSDTVTLTVLVPPTLSVVASAAAGEPGTSGEFLILRTGSTNDTIQAHFTVNGTATPDSDYVALSSPVTLAAGVTSAPLAVVVLNDGAAEPPETVVVTLDANPDYLLTPPLSATVTIADEDNLGPSVAMISPEPDTLFTAPASVPIEVSASDVDGTVQRVEFIVNQTNVIGELTQAPYLFVWTNAPAGDYIITARATDNLGAAAASDPVPIVINAPPAISMTSPASGSFFKIPTDVPLAASANDSDGVITQVEFLEGNNVLNVDLEAPYEFDWLDVPMNTYTLRARATDDRGATTLSGPVTISVGVQLPAFADDFASRGLILGFENSLQGTNTTYTKEAGEPNHDGVAGDKTAWISWLAPASDTCTMDTFGSNFDTVLAVYTGEALGQLTVVASNDDTGGSQSRVQFATTAGTTYQIAVTGWSSSDSGVFQFNQSMPNPGPSIVTHPQSQTVSAGDSVTFTVEATGGQPLTYQWRKDGADIPNATGTTLSLQNVQGADAGNYTVIVSNPGGSVTSNPALLTLLTPPQITAHPQGQVVDQGEDVMLSVTATGTAPLTYQWRLNGSNIAGATAAALNLNNVQYAEGGSYSVTVLNGSGLAVSQSAALIIRPRIIEFRSLPAGDFQFTYEGTPGQAYQIEISTNLMNWFDHRVLTNSTVEQEVTDPEALSRRYLHYRLRLTP